MSKKEPSLLLSILFVHGLLVEENLFFSSPWFVNTSGHLTLPANQVELYSTVQYHTYILYCTATTNNTARTVQHTERWCSGRPLFEVNVYVWLTSSKSISSSVVKVSVESVGHFVNLTIKVVVSSQVASMHDEYHIPLLNQKNCRWHFVDVV